MILRQLYWLGFLCSSGPVSAAPFIYSASAQRLCSGESRWNKTSSIPDETPTFPPITPKQRSRSLSAISHHSTLAVCVMSNGTVCAPLHMCIYVFSECFLCVKGIESVRALGRGRKSRGSAEGTGLGSRCVCLMSSCKESWGKISTRLPAL